MNPLFSQKFAILTAENPRYESAQGGNPALEQEMKAKGLKFTPIKGKYGVSENSYLVENPNHQDILSWGKKYGQDSVIVSDGGLHRMIYTNGPHEKLWHEGHSISIHDKEPKDFYSTVNLNNKPTHFSIDFDMDTKHGAPMKKSDFSRHLIHFSNTQNLKELDPEFQGTAGRHSPETKHGKPYHPRIYFYEENTPTESVVTGGAKSKYIVKHPGDDKIYDIGKDSQGLLAQAHAAWLEKPSGSHIDAKFKYLKEKGFLGFKNSASALPNVVALFHKTPVEAEIPAPTDYTSDEGKRWTEAKKSMKKSETKKAVEAIKGKAKVNEVLAEAKPNMRSKILAALRKEKLEKMNGSGVPGAGGATPPTMAPAVPAAPGMGGAPLMRAEESESRMAKKDLKDIMEYAQALDGMVAGSEDLEDWVDSKITIARQYLSDIAHYLSYENGQPTEELDKGDVIGMKDKKVISTDTKAAPKELVAQQPKAAKNERALAQRVKSNWEGPRPELAKSDSKKAKFERCVLAVKKKSSDKVNPWAVCHASVDGAKKSEDLEKADMKVKEQEKPTKGMPQAKQLKADADLKKIEQDAESMVEKKHLNKSGFFKQDKKTQQPKWHDPLQQEREDAAREERELRPDHKAHMLAMLDMDMDRPPKPQKKTKEPLEKRSKNVRKQQEAVFGGWKTKAGSERREKQIAALADMIKRRFGLETVRAPGKKNAAGKTIDKPNFHDNIVEHIGNPDSLVHEIGHLYQYGKDMNTINPHKEFKNKEQSLSDWQKDMDAHWGELNDQYGYKKQAQTAEEYEPTALENYYRRRAGLPTHFKTAKTEEENRIASEKRGKKYKKPAISRTQAVDDPSKEIVQRVKVKGKNGKEKEVWLTGSMKNLTDKTRELVDQIDRGELVLDPTRGFVEGTSIDARINRRARAASQDKTRKDANTLMRSEELKKKLILGEGKPSKATVKATPEQHKTIMDKLSAALDTVKVDTSPEAQKERKKLLEHVSNKLKGKK